MQRKMPGSNSHWSTVEANGTFLPVWCSEMVMVCIQCSKLLEVNSHLSLYYHGCDDDNIFPSLLQPCWEVVRKNIIFCARGSVFYRQKGGRNTRGLPLPGTTVQTCEKKGNFILNLHSHKGLLCLTSFCHSWKWKEKTLYTLTSNWFFLDLRF